MNGGSDHQETRWSFVGGDELSDTAVNAIATLLIELLDGVSTHTDPTNIERNEENQTNTRSSVSLLQPRPSNRQGT